MKWVGWARLSDTGVATTQKIVQRPTPLEGPQIVKKETQGWVMTVTMTYHKNTGKTFLNRLVKPCETEDISEN